jgi:diguanylate cyclase (GGDEF)-like protein
VTELGAAELGGAVPALVELPGLLARSTSGLRFVYQALDLCAARYHLRDAVVIVESPITGRQVFRLGRGALREGLSGTQRVWFERAMASEPGLYTDPPVVERVTAMFVTHLVEVALRLDVLDHDASHDPLTGLLNRRSYELALDQAVARTERYGWPFALVLLDLDNFKAVNDELGHAAGDAALRALGGEVRACLRSGDVAARLGGDEFALLLLNADSSSVLEPIAERLRLAMDRAVPDAGVRFSAGVALYPHDAGDVATLMRVADERLYLDKATTF